MKKLYFNGVLIYSVLMLAFFPALISAQVESDRTGNAPKYMRFEPGNQPAVQAFFNDYRQIYAVSDDSQFDEMNVSSNAIGNHHRYGQTYKGIEIMGAQYILHERNGLVWYANGQLIHDLDMDVNPVLTEEGALIQAMNSVNAKVYKWENPANEEFIKNEQDDPAATFYPRGELMLSAGINDLKAENIRLVYRFDIYAEQPLGRYWVDVDAKTGDIVAKLDRIHHGDVPGSGSSLYNGPVSMTVDEVTAGNFRLQGNTTRGAVIRTFDMQTDFNYEFAVDFQSSDATGPWDATGVSTHWGSEASYDYFYDHFNRNSMDDAGFPINSYVHFSYYYNNAFWDGSRLTYGDGDGYFFGPWNSIDIVGHELTHGVTEFTSNLIYHGESGALNESFSDIFGNLIEFETEGAPGTGTGSWRCGEDITLNDVGAGIRNMANPNEFDDPDTYLGDFWADVNGIDNGGVHINSGVQNFWFYLLAEGGSGTNDNGDAYDVVGIGLDDAASIAYHNNTSFLVPYSNFYDARAGSILCAEAEFGAGSQQAISVAEAWDAVGVYEGGSYQYGTVIIKKVADPMIGGVDFAFASRHSLTVNSPAGFPGPFLAGRANFGPELTYSGLSGELEIVDDELGTGTDGCQPLAGFTAGKIALIDRGSCTFVTKINHAQNAGAVAAVIVNNIPGGSLIDMADDGSGTVITIPSIFISKEDGDLIKAQINEGAPVNVTLNGGGLAFEVILQHGEEYIVTDVIPGTYRVWENNTVFNGYDLADIAIDDPDNGSTGDVPNLTAIIDVDPGEVVVCTFENQINLSTIMAKVESLNESGALSNGLTNALLAKLQAALASIEKGKYNTATKQLNAFVNQVNDLIDDGILTPEQGNDLIADANTVIVLLQSDELTKSIAVAPAVTETESETNFLTQNHPNPFSGTTGIDFSVESTGHAVVRVYNSMGKEVSVLFDGTAEAGSRHSLEFDGSGLPQGVYYYHLQISGGVDVVRKMILIK